MERHRAGRRTVAGARRGNMYRHRHGFAKYDGILRTRCVQVSIRFVHDNTDGLQAGIECLISAVAHVNHVTADGQGVDGQRRVIAYILTDGVVAAREGAIAAIGGFNRGGPCRQVVHFNRCQSVRQHDFAMFGRAVPERHRSRRHSRSRRGRSHDRRERDGLAVNAELIR